MAAPTLPMRPLTRLKPLLRHARAFRHQQEQRRCISVQQLADFEDMKPVPYRKPFRSSTHTTNIKIHAPPPSALKKCPDPISAITSTQLTTLDPSGSRTRLFQKTNPECAKVGDILLVRQRNGDPFSGVCINIRRRGIDTAVLLRGQMTRVGVEMWFKVYSPNVEGIEIVERAKKRARRARLTYMRLKRHDRGSVENVVRVYLRQKAALGAGGRKSVDAGVGGGDKGKGKKGGKKKR